MSLCSPLSGVELTSFLVSGSGTLSTNFTVKIAGGLLSLVSSYVLPSSILCCHGYSSLEEACILASKVLAAVITRRRRSSKTTKSTLRMNLESLPRTPRHCAICVNVGLDADKKKSKRQKYIYIYIRKSDDQFDKNNIYLVTRATRLLSVLFSAA